MHDHAETHAAHAASGTVKDPVCGMNVDPLTSKHRASFDARTFHFCSAGCKAKFEANPDRYVADAGRQQTPPAAAGAIYTCPMHPQIRQVGPGNCPICGMTLEPVDATAEVGKNHELADMTRRFWIALTLTAPVFVLEMGAHVPALGLH